MQILFLAVSVYFWQKHQISFILCLNLRFTFILHHLNQQSNPYSIDKTNLSEFHTYPSIIKTIVFLGNLRVFSVLTSGNYWDKNILDVLENSLKYVVVFSINFKKNLCFSLSLTFRSKKVSAFKTDKNSKLVKNVWKKKTASTSRNIIIFRRRIWTTHRRSGPRLWAYVKISQGICPRCFRDETTVRLKSFIPCKRRVESPYSSKLGALSK